MVSAKFLVPALAIFGLAAAQSSSTSTSLCAQQTATISSQSDASALAAACSTVTGSVAIASSVTGAIQLDGIEQIKGDLTCIGASNLTQLTGSTLNAIGGALNLQRLTIMSTLGLPSLTAVGSINFVTLNALQQLTFTAQVTKASSILITDTALISLDGINLQTVGNFEVTNCGELRLISTQVANVTQALTISANGPMLNLSFPNLIWANNMTVRNVSGLSIPSLAVVNSTFGIYSSYMSSILAPNLTEVGGDLALVADSSLTNASMPLLQTVTGGLLIANNSNLLDISGFPKLQNTGAISVSGNYTTFGLPSLQNCKGSFNAQSSGNFSCDPFQTSKNGGVIKGSYTCSAKSNNVQASGVTGSGTASATGSAASSTSTKGAASISKVNAEMFGFSALVGGLALLVL